MKFVQTLFLALLPVLSSAQFNIWKTLTVFDEWGDVTDEIIKDFACDGVFSNSTTSDSDLWVRVSHQRQMIIMELFENQSPPNVALGLSDSTGKIKVKRADGTVESYNAFAPATGGVRFSESVGGEFIDLLVDGGGEEITVLIKQEDFSEYGKPFCGT